MTRINMIINLNYVLIPSWSGYKNKYLPQRMALLNDSVCDSFIEMNNACEERIVYTDAYRSVQSQIKLIGSSDKTKRRLFATPTKSGHNFGFSLDVAVSESLSNLRNSSKKSLVEAGQSRDAMAAFMLEFGWSGISKEEWHFNGPGCRNVSKKIDEVYGAFFLLSAKEMQSSLNELNGCNLTIDGVIGPKTKEQIIAAKKSLNIQPEDDSVTDWFRRVLSCATAKVSIKKRWSNAGNKV